MTKRFSRGPVRGFKYLHADQGDNTSETIAAETETILDEGVLSSFQELVDNLKEPISNGDVASFVQDLKDLIDIGAKTFGAENIIPDGIWSEVAQSTADAANEVSTTIIEDAITEAIDRIQKNEVEKNPISTEITQPTEVTQSTGIGQTMASQTKDNSNNLRGKTMNYRQALTNNEQNLTALKSEVTAIRRGLEAERRVEEKATNRVLLEERVDDLIKARKMDANQKKFVMGLFEAGKEEEVIEVVKGFQIASPRPKERIIDGDSPYPSRIEAASSAGATLLYEHDVDSIEESINKLNSASRQQLAGHFTALNGKKPNWTKTEEVEGYRSDLITNLELARGR
jgi:hypothetical protein